MSRVSVVIPYFQRDRGILHRALASVYAQSLADEWDVEIVIVDDQSPSPPELELEGLERPHFKTRIVKRPNGGPAAARNTGIESADHPDYIAFLDSDDWWMSHHLATGLGALKAGSQFYFANNFYEGEHTWFDGLFSTAALLEASSARRCDVYSIKATAILPIFFKECLATTSSVIVDAGRSGAFRFDETQVLAGEDYLFFLKAVSASDCVSFCATPTAARGRGVSIYRSALDWGSPNCVRRLYYNLTLRKKMLHDYADAGIDARAMRAEIVLLRRGIIYLFMRNALVHLPTNLWVARELLLHDAGFWPSFPMNAAITLQQKLAGKLEFPLH